MIHQLSQHGLSHTYMTIHKIKFNFCLGHDIILTVITDDSTIFNPTSTLWPIRHKTEWVFLTLNGDMSDVIFIHYRSYYVPPNNSEGSSSDDDGGRDDPAAAFESKARVQIDLR